MDKVYWQGLWRGELDRWTRRFREHPEEIDTRWAPDRWMDAALNPVLAPGGPWGPRVLEIGSGPVSRMGLRRSRAGALAATFTDPLAELYRQLWPVLRRTQPHPLIPVAGEELDRFYPAKYFDAVYCRDAMDQGYDPPAILRAATAVTRVGGAIVLRHRVRGGTATGWEGMRQWDLFARDGALVVADRDGAEQSFQHADGLFQERLLEYTEDGQEPWLLVVYRRAS